MGKKILSGGILLLVVLGGGVYWLIQVTGEPVKVIRAQLEAINAEDYTRAYSYFSASFREKMSLEEFETFVEENSAVMKTQESSFPSRRIQNDMAVIEGELTGQGGQKATVRYRLVKEGEQWMITNIKF